MGKTIDASRSTSSTLPTASEPAVAFARYFFADGVSCVMAFTRALKKAESFRQREALPPTSQRNAASTAYLPVRHQLPSAADPTSLRRAIVAEVITYCTVVVPPRATMLRGYKQANFRLDHTKGLPAVSHIASLLPSYKVREQGVKTSLRFRPSPSRA